ncbi:MAG: DNA repair protein RecO [Candidatus Omnitrophica bacterium]|nr:DNA repair protein RecO [Candidatus Omnitrophota bacterium]
MAVNKTHGFILRREDVRETSVLLTVYTRDFGKLRMISKGVRSPEQRFVSAYELFALVEIVFYDRKRGGGAFLLSQCELVEYFPKIRESLDRLSYASYFIDLVNSTASLGEKNIKIFELIRETLGMLSTGASPKRVARIFEIKLLSILGFMPRLRSCAACNKKTEGQKKRFSFSSGGVLCAECSKKETHAKDISEGTINFISRIEELPFKRIQNIKVSKSVGSEVEWLLKNFISYHLDTRPKSMEFISKIGV